MKTEKIIWGLIFIFIGGVILLENFGVIDFYWTSIWRFWPLILVVIGANMLLNRGHGTSGALIAAAITIAALAFIGYQGTRPYQGGNWTFKYQVGDDNESGKKSSGRFTEPYTGNTQRAQLNIKGGATSYRLRDTTENLFDARVKKGFGTYILEKTFEDSTEVLSFRMRSRNQKWQMHNNGNNAEIRLNNHPIWDINVDLGAGETDFDLSSFKVRNVRLHGGAASFKVKLPEPETKTTVTVATGMADINIKVPTTAGCRITVETGLSSRDFEGFTKQADGSYLSNNYNTAAKKIDISLKGGMSNFTVSRY